MITIQQLDCRNQFLDCGWVWFYAIDSESMRVVATISVDTKPADSWWVNNLYVDPACRRRSIATRLAAAVYQYAYDSPDVKLLCSAVDPENAASVRMHEALGMRHVHTYENGKRLYSREISRSHCQN